MSSSKKKKVVDRSFLDRDIHEPKVSEMDTGALEKLVQESVTDMIEQGKLVVVDKDGTLDFPEDVEKKKKKGEKKSKEKRKKRKGSKEKE